MAAHNGPVKESTKQNTEVNIAKTAVCLGGFSNHISNIKSILKIIGNTINSTIKKLGII